MTKPCYIDLTDDYDEIDINMQFINEPFVWRAPIQATVISGKEFIGIFKS